MSVTHIFLILCVFCTIAPVMPKERDLEASDNMAFPGWPEKFEGRPLKRLSLSKREKRFLEDMPGKVARFSDGKQEIILRWINAPSRKLHPASDCFKGIGYHITPLPILMDASKNWSQFEAQKGEQRLLIRERIFNSAGQQWSDTSAWYWSAFMDRSKGPWWTVTVAQTLPSE